MTCIELIVFLVMIMFAAYGAVKVGPMISAQWWGFAAGAVVGLAAFFLIILLLLLILDGFFGHGLPPCEERSCTGGDYTTVEAGDGPCHECKHGLRYRKRGNHFMKLNPDGTESPYYMWKRFRGWRKL